jgi:hypothetical protein
LHKPPKLGLIINLPVVLLLVFDKGYFNVHVPQTNRKNTVSGLPGKVPD